MNKLDGNVRFQKMFPKKSCLSEEAASERWNYFLFIGGEGKCWRQWENGKEGKSEKVEKGGIEHFFIDYFWVFKKFVSSFFVWMIRQAWSWPLKVTRSTRCSVSEEPLHELQKHGCPRKQMRWWGSILLVSRASFLIFRIPVWRRNSM